MNGIRFSSSLLTSDLVIHGAGIATGIIGALLKPATGNGETCTEEITVELSGTVAQIESALMQISRCIEWGAEDAGRMLAPVYLEAQATSASAWWRSPVLGGKVELSGAGADQRGAKRQGAKVTIIRADWWEAVTETTLVNSAALENHADSGHSNRVYFTANSATDQDLPAVPRVVVATDSISYGPVLVFAGERSGKAGELDLFTEADDGYVGDGVTGTTTVDADCSDGHYLALAWTGSSEANLWNVYLSETDLGSAGGKPFRILARLRDSLPTTSSEKLWARWELAYIDRNAGGVERPLFSLPPGYLETQSQLLFGPVVYLPPWLADGNQVEMRLHLWATAVGAGSHLVNLDWVTFVPLDGWRLYDPLLGENGATFSDEGGQGMVGAVNGPKTHQASGPGFLIRPGQAHQFEFYLLAKEASDKTAAPSLAAHVSIYYRPRRRVL